MKYLVPVGPIPRHPDTTFAPHRLCAHVLECVAGVSPALQWAAKDALATLPPLTTAATERGIDLVDRFLSHLHTVPTTERLHFVIAFAYRLHERTPSGRVWTKVREGIDRACQGIGEAAVFAQDDAAEALYCALYPEAP